MANHFPTLPTLNLLSIQYTVTISSGGNPIDANAFAVDGVSVDGSAIPTMEQGSPLALGFTFDTPGDAGSFDQDAAEAQVASYITAVLEALIALNGDTTLAEAQEWVYVMRQWQWGDSENHFFCGYNDTMTYPA